MNTAEQADNFRLKKALEHIEYCRNAENEARARLTLAVESAKRAKEKHEVLFLEYENRAVARRKSGEIIVNPGY